MDCSENQYYYKGECHLCQQCRPGQELSEDCGYGSGKDAYCTSCNAKSYKEDWGHQSCRLCQSCKLLNRHEKFPCTIKSNAVCGECLPGFYSKTRIDGLHDLECMPCGPSSAREQQCIRSRGEGVQKVWSTEAAPQGSATACFIGGALVAGAIAVSVLLFVYYRRTSLRKMFEACAGSKKCSPSENYQASINAGIGDSVILNLEKEVHVSGPCEGLTAVDSLTSVKACLTAHSFPGSMATTSEIQPCSLSSSSETQPLIRCITCSNCSLVCVSQRSSSSANSGEYLVEPSPIPFDENNLYCASDQKERHQHAPVECTELDFHSLFVPEGKAAFTEVTEDSTQSISAEQMNCPSDCSLQSTNSCLNCYQQFCSSRCRNTLSNIRSLMQRSCSLMQGIHLGRLPQVLINSLALKLNSAFPGVKNYQQVALELGVPLEALQNLQGFEHVFQYLSSCTLQTVPDLLNTFYHLQRFDALLLLCEYATKSQLTACSH